MKWEEKIYLLAKKKKNNEISRPYNSQLDLLKDAILLHNANRDPERKRNY